MAHPISAEWIPLDGKTSRDNLFRIATHIVCHEKPSAALATSLRKETIADVLINFKRFVDILIAFKLKACQVQEEYFPQKSQE